MNSFPWGPLHGSRDYFIHSVFWMDFEEQLSDAVSRTRYAVELEFRELRRPNVRIDGLGYPDGSMLEIGEIELALWPASVAIRCVQDMALDHEDEIFFNPNGSNIEVAWFRDGFLGFVALEHFNLALATAYGYTFELEIAVAPLHFLNQKTGLHLQPNAQTVFPVTL